jgi:fatty acid desaturase
MATTPAAHSDLHQHLRRTLLSPERVRELSERRPRRVARDIAIWWATILAAWLVAAAIGGPLAALLGAVVVGNRFYSLFIIGHDGLHRRLVKGTKRNDIVCDAFVMAPIGAITRLNNRNHLLHHAHLATAADPDRFKHCCFNKRTRLELVGYLTAVTSVLLTVAHVFNRRRDGGSDTTDVDGHRVSERDRRSPRDLALLVGWQVALLVGLTILFGWWGYILMWWAPVFVFTFLADNLRTFGEHGQAASDDIADGERLITTDASFLERQLLAPMNMNFHAVHHLWPSIPYYNLPIADAEVRRAAAADVIEIRRSYLGFLRRYAAALPIDGCAQTANP